MSNSFWFGFICGMLTTGLLLPTGCAAMGEIMGGAASGVGEAMPEALEELSSGNWMGALMTLGGAAIAGGGAYFWGKKRERKKNLG